MARPLKAAIVSSTKPDSLSVSVWIVTWTSCRSATSRQVSIAFGVVPQSSCSFRPQAPASTCSSSARPTLALPLPMKPRFIGKASAAFSIEWMCHGPGVQVVAKVPVAGPVPPPSIVVTPLASASSICCGQMKWMCESMPPAVTIIPSPAMISVPGPMTMSTPGCTSGLPALPSAGDAAGLDRDVGLDDAPVVEHQRIGDDGVGHLRREALALAHAVADGLAAAELHLLAVAAGAQGVVVLDLDHEAGVGEADAVADGGAEHLGIGAAGSWPSVARVSAWSASGTGRPPPLMSPEGSLRRPSPLLRCGGRPMPEAFARRSPKRRRWRIGRWGAPQRSKGGEPGAAPDRGT